MGKLWDDIIRFVDTEVIPELLLAKLQSRGKPKPAIAHIKIDNHPSLLETKLVKLTTSSYTITIPRNWICRLCLIFQLVDSMENADESRSRIYIFDTDHAFEAHFFDVTNDSKASFFSVPDLYDLFSINSAQDDFCLDHFEERFNENHGGGRVLLDFDLPSELTDRVKHRVRAASKFILYHELAHFLRFHHDLLEHWPFPSIPRRSELGATIAAYRRKAFEVDADAFAFSLLLNEAYNFTNGFVPSSVAELYRDIALLFCCFDSARRSLRDYQGTAADYPIPDIRYSVMSLAAKDYLRQNTSFADMERIYYDQGVEYAARALQRLGMLGGFYVSANRIISADTQSMKDLTVYAAIVARIPPMK